MSLVPLRIVAGLSAALAMTVVAPATAATHKKTAHRPAPSPVTVKVLSGRADLVSGGDALVAIGGTDSTAGLRVTAAGADQTGAFGIGPDGQVEGLVTGLA